MKRLLFFGVSILFALTASAEGVIMKAFKSQKEYYGIEVGGPIKVFVEERTEGNIIIRGTEHILSQIEVNVDEGVLNIYFSKDFHIKNRNEVIQAEVYVPNNGKLREFTAAACGVIEVEPQISAKDVEIECAAASAIDIENIVADKLSVDVVGAAKTSLNVVCTSVDIEVTGASRVDISGKATKAEIDIVGASTIDAENLHCQQLEADVAGASKARLTADMAEIDVAGASSANITCTTRLDASATGASTIRYSGDCQVNIIDSAGTSSIKKR